jgi:glycosyltransferase involved in cell wall biosynthesis
LFKGVLGRVALAMLAREDAPPPLKFEHAICVSAATRDKLVAAGVPIAQARIIHTGLEWVQYTNGDQPHSQDENQELKLLYAGRLSADKGVETAIEAMAHLVHTHGLNGATLSLAGSGSADYMDHLGQLVMRRGMDSHVTFLGWIPFEEMPHLMRQFDALLVPSRWPEPFARVVLEGMIAGLVIVATPVGGTSEIVRDGQNGLLFTPDDSEDLARQIARLAAEPQLRRSLARAGRQTIREEFTSERMLEQIESYLREVAERAMGVTTSGIAS